MDKLHFFVCLIIDIETYQKPVVLRACGEKNTIQNKSVFNPIRFKCISTSKYPYGHELNLMFF